MKEVNDGGCALPLTGGNENVVEIGMNLRDYFAAKAMPEMAWSDDGHNDSRARRCYAVADSMLRARENS